MLAAEGLIELLPNRGARVRQLSQRDLDELFDVMAGLESLAGRLACEAITDEEIAAIEQLHYEMYGHYLHRDMHGYFQANQRIHESIVAAARNETLKTRPTPTSPDASAASATPPISPASGERWAEAMREHEAILDALRRRAGERAQRHPVPAPAQQADGAIEHLAEPEDDAPAAP